MKVLADLAMSLDELCHTLALKVPFPLGLEYRICKWACDLSLKYCPEQWGPE